MYSIAPVIKQAFLLTQGLRRVNGWETEQRTQKGKLQTPFYVHSSFSQSLFYFAHFCFSFAIF